MKKFKLYIGIILVTLVALFAFQNNDQVQVDFLFWSFGMSRIVLILGSLLVGMVAAWLISAFFFNSHSSK